MDDLPVGSTANELTVTASSSNESLVPPANIVLAGEGASRTATITPALNQFGTATITLTVTDDQHAASQHEFTVTVNEENDEPTISALGSRMASAEGRISGSR